MSYVQRVKKILLRGGGLEFKLKFVISSRCTIFMFFGKNSHFSAIYFIFRTFAMPFEKTTC